jgi:hypothetical protein
MKSVVLEHLHQCSVCDPAKIISHIQVLVTSFFPTPPIKLKLWLEVGGRLVIATHLDQSNYLGNQKQGALNKLCNFYRVQALDFTLQPHPKFPVGVGGSHTEHWWRCSYYVNFTNTRKTHSWIYISNPSPQRLYCNLLPQIKQIEHRSVA